MPTFKRTIQDLDGKIAQEQPKEAPKPIEPKQYDPAKEFAKQEPKQGIPHIDKVRAFLKDNPDYQTQGIKEFTYDDGKTVLTGDVYKGDKRVARLEFDKEGNPIDEHSEVFSDIDFSAQEPKQEEDEIERFDDEMQYSYDYIYKGLPRNRQIAIFAERMDITPEKAKEYFDSLDKRNAEQKKKIKAKKEQEEKTSKANEQKRVLGLVEQLREAKRAKNDELAQSIIDQILNPDNLPF